VNWDTTPKTTTVTAVSGVGYFVDTTSNAITVNLPAGVAGAIVAVSDYANTAATNFIIITPNGTDKIDGVNASYYLSTNGAAITLIYVDATRGWKDVNDATLNAVGVVPTFIAATGGTVTCCGNFKIHTFTGPGTFTVTSVGNLAGSNTVDYLVVAGGGGGGYGRGGGGGAGGARMSSGTASGGYTASPLGSGVSALPVSVQGYPITVGGGGNGKGGGGSPPNIGSAGTNSVFSTITSAGGGAGSGENTAIAPSMNGGSGGGGARENSTGTPGGTGNTPPTSPSQGTNGGSSYPGSGAGGGGGGAAAAGSASTPLGPGGAGGTGGTGITNAITGSSVGYAGGGGGGNADGAPNSNLPNAPSVGGGGIGGTGICSPANAAATAGTTNRGAGGGGGGHTSLPTASFYIGANGGSGIVVIRYKYQ
jgi:hypothetical protein